LSGFNPPSPPVGGFGGPPNGGLIPRDLLRQLADPGLSLGFIPFIICLPDVMEYSGQISGSDRLKYFMPFLMIAGLLLTSCGKDNKIDLSIGFSIKFSEGTVIEEQDIAFYDSSTCILFLKEDLYIVYAPEDSPYTDYTEFKTFVGSDMIYRGIIWPSIFCMGSPAPLYISSYSYPVFESSIIPINYIRYYRDSTQDPRNDPRIIMSLEISNLLHHGISCTIDDVGLSSLNNSIVICTITITNHDLVNYYIPDPAKMGAQKFNYYTGGLYLENVETEESYRPETSNATMEWNYTTMDELSLLKSKSELTWTYESTFDSYLEQGLYDCELAISVPRHFVYDNVSLPLDQEDGRVWVGYMHGIITDKLIN
jgi:hypothetical protein